MLVTAVGSLNTLSWFCSLWGAAVSPSRHLASVYWLTYQFSPNNPFFLFPGPLFLCLLGTPKIPAPPIEMVSSGVRL